MSKNDSPPRLPLAAGRQAHPRKRTARTVATVTVAGMSLLLAACSGSSTASSSSSSAPAPASSAAAVASSPAAPASSAAASAAPASSAAAATDLAQYIGNPDPALCNGREYTFGYNTFSDTEEFAANLWKGIEDVAAQIGCVKVNKLSDNVDPATAVANAKIFAQQKVDGALLFNVLEAAGPGQVQVLQQAGIPAVSIVVEAPDETFVTNDDMADGIKVGTALGQAYLDSGKTGPVYAVLGRFDGQGKTGIARLDGVKKGLQDTVPGIQIEEFETKADPPTAQSGTAAVLGKIPDGATILVSGINDQIAYSMLQAVKQAKREKDAMVMSIGAVNPGGLQFICQNPEYVGALGFFPENWPKYMIPALIARVQGVPIEHKYVVPTEIIARDKINEFYPDFKCDK
jgi:ABC-type sugar transport system substrate-binding protein